MRKTNRIILLIALALLPVVASAQKSNSPKSKPGSTFRYPPNFNKFNTGQFSYQNGLMGRPNNTLYSWGSTFFPGGVAAYPFYFPGMVNGTTLPSLYSGYNGLFPPYIGQNGVVVQQPAVIYVPVPLYDDGEYKGWKRDDTADYYLNREPEDADTETGATRGSSEDAARLQRITPDIRRVWRQSDIQALARYVRPNSRIAVTLRGVYQYSLAARDYLDMTRDALRTMKTLRFDLEAPRRKTKNVYALNGKHVYEDKEGEKRVVYVSYILEKRNNTFTITQVGTAPDRSEE